MLPPVLYAYVEPGVPLDGPDGVLGVEAVPGILISTILLETVDGLVTTIWYSHSPTPGVFTLAAEIVAVPLDIVAVCVNRLVQLPPARRIRQ